MMGNPMVAKSIASKMGQQSPQGGVGGDMMAQQPGSLTDSLVGALRALQTYSKMAVEANPEDPDVSLVRKIMQAISMLVAKDQQEGQGTMGGGMGQGSIMGGMGGGDPMAGVPSMPDLSSILGQQGQ